METKINLQQQIDVETEKFKEIIKQAAQDYFETTGLQIDSIQIKRIFQTIYCGNELVNTEIDLTISK